MHRALLASALACLGHGAVGSRHFDTLGVTVKDSWVVELEKTASDARVAAVLAAVPGHTDLSSSAYTKSPRPSTPEPSTPPVPPTPSPGSGQCVDRTVGGEAWHVRKRWYQDCAWFERGGKCDRFGSLIGAGAMTAKDACCACGGGGPGGPPLPTPEPEPPASGPGWMLTTPIGLIITMNLICSGCFAVGLFSWMLYKKCKKNPDAGNHDATARSLLAQFSAVPGSEAPVDSTCPVCLDSAVPPSPRGDAEAPASAADGPKWSALSCGHGFHERCILQWMQQKLTERSPLTCPVCRTEMSVGQKTAAVPSATSTEPFADENQQAM